ncbi:MAG: sodium-dependent transporter [Oscillospiraceae bacterium]|nr:sodium-dependent transporter [Oscillospiraceae bacterium]
MKKEQWGTNFGFLMAAIGSAVGLGNLWGFPYKMGKSGGFAFLVIYLVLVVLVGSVVMLGELGLGRKTGKGVMGTYLEFSKKHAWMGYMGVVSGFLILSFYCVLGGVVTRYMIGYAAQLVGAEGFAGQGADFFGYFLYSPLSMVLFYAIFMALTLTIVMGGVQKGIEKFSSIAMPALVAILVFIIIYVACQPGAVEGYKFMFKPDFSVFSNPEIGFFGVFKSAAGQMFFSLSLGMGCMMTYGSYLSKKENLQKNALIIPLADTTIALLAGCAIMPACAAFGVDFSRGPGLLFVSMQTVFENMGGFGAIIGFLFYFLVFIAALTSSISILEVCTAFQIDKDVIKGKEPNRKKISFIYAIAIFIFGLPVALDALGSGGAAIMAPFELLGLEAGGPGYAMWNDCWLDVYDLIAEGILMPIGALVMSVLIGWFWKTDIIKNECELSGKPFVGYKFYDFCFKFVVPVVMAFIFYAQLVDFFS